MPTEGRDEVVEHRVNGLVVDPDDLAGTAAAIDLLATRPDLLAELRAGARATAERWPSWEEAGAALLGELSAILETPAEFDAAWPAALMTRCAGRGRQALGAGERADRRDARVGAQLEGRAGPRGAAPTQVDRLRARLRGRS